MDPCCLRVWVTEAAGSPRTFSTHSLRLQVSGIESRSFLPAEFKSWFPIIAHGQSVLTHKHRRRPGEQWNYLPAPFPRSNKDFQELSNPLRGKYQRKSFEVAVIQGQQLVLGSVKSEDTWSQVATNGCTSV